MFPRSRRLTDDKAFSRIFKRGVKVCGRTFSVIHHPSPDGKIGFVITKKTAREAVVRNRIRRRLRAAFQSALQQREFAHLFDRTTLMVVIYRGSEDTEFTALVEDVTRVLKQIPSP